MDTLNSLFEQTGKAISFLVCVYYDNGYVDWWPYATREKALNEGQFNVDWCVVRYNWRTEKYSIIHAEGRTFPVNILCPPYSCGGMKPIITSVPEYQLPSLLSHYADPDHPVVTRDES